MYSPEVLQSLSTAKQSSYGHVVSHNDWLKCILDLPRIHQVKERRSFCLMPACRDAYLQNTSVAAVHALILPLLHSADRDDGFGSQQCIPLP